MLLKLIDHPLAEVLAVGTPAQLLDHMIAIITEMLGYKLAPELPLAAMEDHPLVIVIHHMAVLLITPTVVRLKVQEWEAAGLHLLATPHLVAELPLQAILHLAVLLAAALAVAVEVVAGLPAVVVVAEAAVNQ